MMSLIAIGSQSAEAQQQINLGNNSSQWARDGECDDPRFTGNGMAYDLLIEDVKRDAADCREMLEAGRIRLVRRQSQTSPRECRAIDFGDNSNTYANDGECDDPRFAGPGVDEVLLGADVRTDANDCQTLCVAGSVWIR